MFSIDLIDIVDGTDVRDGFPKYDVIDQRHQMYEYIIKHVWGERGQFDTVVGWNPSYNCLFSSIWGL